jgi:hypothetical protein
MPERRAPVTAFAPHSAAAHCYEALWSELDGTDATDHRQG